MGLITMIMGFYVIEVVSGEKSRSAKALRELIPSVEEIGDKIKYKYEDAGLQYVDEFMCSSICVCPWEARGEYEG